MHPESIARTALRVLIQTGVAGIACGARGGHELTWRRSVRGRRCWRRRLRVHRRQHDASAVVHHAALLSALIQNVYEGRRCMFIRRGDRSIPTTTTTMADLPHEMLARGLMVSISGDAGRIETVERETQASTIYASRSAILSHEPQTNKPPQAW